MAKTTIFDDLLTIPHATSMKELPVIENAMDWVYNDGGREDAGYRGHTGDCVVRSIAIATELPYQKVYDAINLMGKSERISKRKKKKSNSRTGVYKTTYDKYLKSLGWTWTPTMFIGSGCTVHMRKNELPNGRIIVRLSKHLAAVIDGVLHDTGDCTRSGTRCVYGYYSKE
jgi:hypothetical protein